KGTCCYDISTLSILFNHIGMEYGNGVESDIILFTFNLSKIFITSNIMFKVYIEITTRRRYPCVSTSSRLKNFCNKGFKRYRILFNKNGIFIFSSKSQI